VLDSDGRAEQIRQQGLHRGAAVCSGSRHQCRT
jgi:hypothetical protein